MIDMAKKSFRAGPLRIRVSTQGERVPKERLTVDRILDATFEIMRTGGYEAVSMRSVAKALDTGPASLYAHVANREQLDQLVVERIASSIPIPEPDPERWDDQVKQLLIDTLGAYREHPGSARATMGMVPTQVGALRNAEGLMALCMAGGVPAQLAAWFCDLAALYVGAVAVEESIWAERYRVTARDAGEQEWERIAVELSELFSSLPAADFPILSALPDVMTSGDGDDRLGFALDVLLGGLKSLSSREASGEA
jgi:AcrR family transcriptional regulator